MVLAEAVYLNVFDNDHSLASLMEERVIDDVIDPKIVPLGEEQQRFRVTRRRSQQTFAIWVSTHTLKQCPYGATYLLQPRPSLVWAFDDAAWIVNALPGKVGILDRMG